MVTLGWLLVFIPLIGIGIGVLWWIGYMIKVCFESDFWAGMGALALIVLPALMLTGVFILLTAGAK